MVMIIIILVTSTLVGILGYKSVKWLKEDPHRDFVMTMGPIGSGKSELQGAYARKEFGSTETHTWKDPEKIGDSELKLCIAVPDFAGAENVTKENCEKICKEIAKQKPDYALTQIVFDVSKLPSSQDGILAVADQLVLYLIMLNKSIDRDSCSHAAKLRTEGRWCFEIIGTHNDLLDGRVPSTDILQKHLEKHAGKIHRAGHEVTLLDLRNGKGRTIALKHLLKTLARIHKG